MTSLADIFGFNRGTSTPTDELPDIFPVPCTQDFFTKTDIHTIFAKILTDTLERVHGLSEDQIPLLWDNCVKSNSTDGLISMLSKAMAARRELFIIHEKALGVLREADTQEAAEIRKDYEAQARSEKGIYISFKNFERADMVKLYLGLEFLTVASLHKSMNISKAVQLKFSDLRASVSSIDTAAPKEQAQAIAKALKNGRDVMLDAKDSITTTTPDLTAVEAAMRLTVQKLCFYLNLPAAYLSGIQTGGLGTTGEGDTKAIDRGLKSTYYFPILKPVLEALFDAKVTFKSQDFRQVASSMEVYKTFELTDDTLISKENKRKIMNAMLDLPEDAEGDPEPARAPAIPFTPGVNV